MQRCDGAIQLLRQLPVQQDCGHRGLLAQLLHHYQTSKAPVYARCIRIRQLQTSAIRCDGRPFGKFLLPRVQRKMPFRTAGSERGGEGSSLTDDEDVPQEKPATATKLAATAMDTIVKVQPTYTRQRPKIDFSQSYTANIFIEPVRAMQLYLLESSDFESLSRTKRRSPYPESEDITVFLRRDVEQKALEKWGSLENLTKERLKRRLQERQENKSATRTTTPRLPPNAEMNLVDMFNVKEARKKYRKQHEGLAEEKPFIFRATNKRMATESIFKHGSGKVVLYAVAVNATNCVLKGAAWFYTGSHSMFSEFIHSLADTANQLILAVGIHQSLKQPDLEHPYGWASFRNVSSLISGVGFFCVGAGLSWYHGIMGLLQPGHIESLFWAIAIMGGSLLSEGATLLVAINQVRLTAERQKTTFLQTVLRGSDPSTNVVLLEDLAAVFGVTIAATCMGITYYTGNPLADAVGSLLIGTLLGGVASFIIYTNTISLVGRSIPEDQRQELMKEMEDDRMIRALHDVKATSVGGNVIKFKAEVDFDGRELTRYYLEKQDLDTMLKDMQGVQTLEEVELFMLKHGENIVDTLGAEVDRIERDLKKRHPDVRHVDLEQL